MSTHTRDPPKKTKKQAAVECFVSKNTSQHRETSETPNASAQTRAQTHGADPRRSVCAVCTRVKQQPSPRHASGLGAATGSSAAAPRRGAGSKCAVSMSRRGSHSYCVVLRPPKTRTESTLRSMATATGSTARITGFLGTKPSYWALNSISLLNLPMSECVSFSASYSLYPPPPPFFTRLRTLHFVVLWQRNRFAVCTNGFHGNRCPGSCVSVGVVTSVHVVVVLFCGLHARVCVCNCMPTRRAHTHSVLTRCTLSARTSS